ncbi:MAG: hypothetical protein B7Z78_04405 [Rhodospirillales bacterium 20-60-12]|nr:MAG: hypothetical protein B7Z78_04405 [Rhodospirillales bacterium 20-60-12]
MNAQTIDEPPFPLWRAASCGLLAMLVGIGIARFGYAPLVPALIAAHWFSPGAAFTLGAINLLGYLVGAGGMRLARMRINVRLAMLAMMGLTDLCLLASALRWGFWWYAPWRLLSGITGGVLMVLMGQAVVARAPAARRGAVGGLTFAGMGGGIALSGLVIPRILPFGLPTTWLSLAALGIAATIIVGLLMPPGFIEPAPRTARSPTRPNRAIPWLIIAYGLCAVGFVPHILFWASFIAIGLGEGINQGAFYSAILGVAAAIGPPLAGRVADRFGFGRTLAASYLIMAGAVALPLGFAGPVGLALSAFGVGALAMAAVVLTSGMVAERVPAAAMGSVWGAATLTYAIVQAGSAAGFSALFRATGLYTPLFGTGAVALLVGAFIVGKIGGQNMTVR